VTVWDGLCLRATELQESRAGGSRSSLSTRIQRADACFRVSLRARLARRVAFDDWWHRALLAAPQRRGNRLQRALGDVGDHTVPLRALAVRCTPDDAWLCTSFSLLLRTCPAPLQHALTPSISHRFHSLNPLHFSLQSPSTTIRRRSHSSQSLHRSFTCAVSNRYEKRRSSVGR
jgi:hypothetical protein